MKIWILYLMFIPIIVLSQEKMPIQVEETPYLLAKGQFQLENGFAYKNYNKFSKISLLPSILIKFGLSKTIELRLTTEFQINNLSNEYGLNPIIFGFKTKLFSEKSWIPETALVSQIALPKLASSIFQTNKLAPEIILMMQSNYSHLFSMNYNIGLKYDGFSENQFYTYKFTSGLNYTQKWSSYSEIFGNIYSESKPETNINNGIMYLISNDMFLDLSAGFGISDQSPKWFCAIIYSIRI